MTAMHLIYTEYPGYGWSLHSPQIPGLAAGRDTIEELLADTNAILQFAAAPITDMHDPRVRLHEEHAVDAPDGTEYLVRWRTSDELEDVRAEAAGRLHTGVILGLSTEDEVAQQPVLRTGERLLIGVAGSDLIADIEDQVDPVDGCAIVAKHNGDDVVLSMPFGHEGTCIEGSTLEDLGLTRASTINDMADAILSHEAGQLATLHLPSSEAIATLVH